MNNLNCHEKLKSWIFIEDPCDFINCINKDSKQRKITDQNINSAKSKKRIRIAFDKIDNFINENVKKFNEGDADWLIKLTERIISVHSPIKNKDVLIEKIIKIAEDAKTVALLDLDPADMQRARGSERRVVKTIEMIRNIERFTQKFNLNVEWDFRGLGILGGKSYLTKSGSGSIRSTRTFLTFDANRIKNKIIEICDNSRPKLQEQGSKKIHIELERDLVRKISIYVKDSLRLEEENSNLNKKPNRKRVKTSHFLPNTSLGEEEKTNLSLNPTCAPKSRVNIAELGK